MTDPAPRFFQALLLALLFCNAPAPAMPPAPDPGILTQPRPGQARLGESFLFKVEASGTDPLFYQWRRNNRNIAGATNNTLLLTNVSASQAGSYSVRVTNLVGSIISSNAALTVISGSPRLITVDGPVDTGTGAVALVTFYANGVENGFTLSLGYNPAHLGNPSFALSLTNASAEVDLSQTNTGLVGLRVALPPGERFERTNHAAGSFVFELLPGADLAQAGLFLTNAPLALEAFDTNNAPVSLRAQLFLPIILLDPVPWVDAQSGLFVQRVQLANATPNTLSNLVLGVHGLGRDGLSNAITLFNRQFSDSADLNNDGIRETTLSSILVPTLAPGQSVVLTLEFYVSDHVTVPAPVFTEVFGLSVNLRPPRGIIRPVRVPPRFVGGAFLVEFNTRRGFIYYVQYGATMEELRTDPRTVFPPLAGTGSFVQWLDTGPPKTRSAPQDGMRFYQVLEVDQ